MAWRCLAKGDLGFAESYLEGEWSSDDVTQLLKLFLKNRNKLGKTYGGKSILRTTANMYHKLRKNSLKGSRKNIQYHYDLGNNFYKLWLDEGMTYSSALFTSKVSSSISRQEQSLAEAQDNKYQRILDELNVKAGQSILEVGCGWGGFAEKALENDCQLHGVTLSEEQLEFANKRLSHFGDSAQLEIKDYRKIDQQYDHIVSIEMFEATNITIYTKGAQDFIQRYIFPGGMLPSESILSDLVRKNDLQVENRISFGHDYGETLARWERNFLSVIPEMEALGYDKRFQRMWLYYLGYCQAGFEEERIDNDYSLDEGHKVDSTGFLFGIWGLLTKLALALAIGIAFPLLDIVGLKTGSPLAGAPSNMAVITLVILYALMPILCKIWVIFQMWHFPYGRSYFASTLPSKLSTLNSQATSIQKENTKVGKHDENYDTENITHPVSFATDNDRM
ncbi:Tuberculostearic acid methyltransferase UfaA1 [Nymphon striatum]|nr:Tuberculostearic acid methyltransferase UfaA1 [Nymphon striatum]